MPEDRTDFKSLVAVPRQLFDEISRKYGNGEAGELNLSKSESEIRILRPLPKLCKQHQGCWMGSLLFVSALHRANMEEFNRVELHRRMFTTPEALENAGTLYGDKALLTLRAGVIIKKDEFLNAVDHNLSASAEFEFHSGFSFIHDSEFWSVMNEMLNRFSELTAGFPRNVRVRTPAAA